jgi:hypothetical protein
VGGKSRGPEIGRELAPVTGPAVKKGAERAVSRRVSTVHGVARPTVHAMAAQDVFHLVLDLELDLFQPDFFELFWLRQIGAIAEVVYPFVEGVMSGGKLAVLFVALQQLTLQLFEVVWHFDLLRRELALYIHTANLSQGTRRFKVPYLDSKSRVSGSTE